MPGGQVWNGYSTPLTHWTYPAQPLAATDPENPSAQQDPVPSTIVGARDIVATELVTVGTCEAVTEGELELVTVGAGVGAGVGLGVGAGVGPGLGASIGELLSTCWSERSAY